MQPASPNRVRLGPFELDLKAGELRNGDRKVFLQEQPFQILLMLVDSAGGLVTRQQIRERLWSNDTVVEFDHSIHTAIKKLRHALDDSAEDPKYIETVARRGYRLIVSVEQRNGGLTTAPLDAQTPSAPTGAPALSPPHSSNTPSSRPLTANHRLLYALIPTLVLSLSLAAWNWFSSRTINRILSQRELTRNTPENRNLGSAISPDGTHLLYADTKGLHLSAIDTGEIHDIPLPENIQARLWDVAWFSDGEKVALTSQTDDLSIWVTSIFGDAPRQLRTNAKSATVSPQGSAIAFVDAYNHEIWVMDANGENQRRVFSSEHDRCVAPTWSPTGQRLAFIKPQSMGSRFGGSIETIALDGGAPSTVLSDAGLLASGSIANRLLWLRDGRLIFVKSERRKLEDSNLWQVVTNPQTGRVSGQPAKITNWSGVVPILLSASKDGSRLVVTRTHFFDDVYVGELKQNGTVLGSPGRLTVSDSENYADTWTPDSKALLFESDRMGRIQIFKQQMEKDSPEHFIQGSNDEHAATFSPDGAWILYWTTSDDSGTPAERRRLNRLSISAERPSRFWKFPPKQRPISTAPQWRVICASSAVWNRTI